MKELLSSKGNVRDLHTDVGRRAPIARDIQASRSRSEPCYSGAMRSIRQQFLLPLGLALISGCQGQSAAVPDAGGSAAPVSDASGRDSSPGLSVRDGGGLSDAVADAGKVASHDAGVAASSGPCAGSPVFCDDFSMSSLASSYVTSHGTWTRGAGSYSVTDATPWERARATIATGANASDFDVTVVGQTEGDYGLGLLFGASATTDDGYAVLVHPAQFQGIFLKKLVPGASDVELGTVALPAGLAGTKLTLRVKTQGTSVTVWLNGVQQLTGTLPAPVTTGRLGLVLSDTDNPGGAGGNFTLFRVDSTGAVATGAASEAGSPPSADAGHADAGSPSPYVPTGYKLVLSDEFNSGTLDHGRWMTQYPGGETSLNDEIEHYTNDGANLHLQNGMMVIEGDQDLSSGVFTAQPSFKFGYFELRATMSVTKGAWPAYWLTSDSRWPPEWDIFEVVSSPGTVYEYPHPATGDNNVSCDTNHVVPGLIDVNVGYHIFGFLWTETDITWWIDGMQTEHCTTDAASSTDFMWLSHNLAIGGSWPGNPDGTTSWPMTLTIDYTRVYQDGTGQLNMHNASGNLVDPDSPQ